MKHMYLNYKEKKGDGDEKRVKYLLHPQSRRIGIWDVIMTIVLLFTSIFRPYQVAFDKESVYKASWNNINIICEVMFILDMLVVFNTAYYEFEFHLI